MISDAHNSLQVLELTARVEIVHLAPLKTRSDTEPAGLAHVEFELSEHCRADCFELAIKSAQDCLGSEALGRLQRAVDVLSERFDEIRERMNGRPGDLGGHD